MSANSEFLELGAVRRGKALGKSFGFLNYESNLPICPFPPNLSISFGNDQLHMFNLALSHNIIHVPI